MRFSGCRLGGDAVKVASYDCASYPLLKDLKAKFKHLFVSTGATYEDEVEKAAQVLTGTSFSFLHCVTIYPTPLNELHLARMQYLRQFTPSVGFSDHTLVERDGIKASVVALHLGADLVERHFTTLPPDKTKDGPVSINPSQLKTLCGLAHGSADDRNVYVKENMAVQRWSEWRGVHCTASRTVKSRLLPRPVRYSAPRRLRR